MKKAGLFLIFTILLAGLAFSQSYRGQGRLTGIVTDQDGKPIEGVRVKLFSVKAAQGLEVMTDAKGEWKAMYIRGGAWNIDFDKAGNLLVADYGGGAIRVFNPAGELLESIEAPFEKVTNVHFGGEDGRWVYVTENTYDGLWKFHWRHAGQAQYCVR